MNEFQNQIHCQLISSLKPLKNLRHCAFLDYPDHLNIGDHLIWLGSWLYLTDVNKTEVNYIASAKDFNEDSFLITSQNSPIVFTGGGNLGDLWPGLQNFREYLIGKYKDREIYILPQTIYFRDTQNLEKAKQVFNSHPNLTLFCRDKVSYEIAKKHFDACQIQLAPDMAFQLLEPRYRLQELQVRSKTGESLYLKRKDKETLDDFNIDTDSYLDSVENWVSLHRIDNRSAQKSRLQREIFPDVIPGEFYHKTKGVALEKQNLTFNLLYMGVQQLSKYSLIVTDRLHGHILSILLGIPNIFLPNSYHKNQGFYETWTEGYPNSVFLKSVEEFQQFIKGTPEQTGFTDEKNRLNIILSNIRHRNDRIISMPASQSKSGQSRLEEIKADLSGSRLRLAEIRGNLAQVSGKNIASEAEADCQQLVAKYPDHPEGKIGLARVAEANEDWNGALKYWDQCLTLFPQQDPLPYLEAKARVLIQLGREKEAEELFKPIIEKFLKDQQINL